MIYDNDVRIIVGLRFVKKDDGSKQLQYRYLDDVTVYEGEVSIAAGDKLYFFETGTSTPKNTFTSTAATIVNTNPVVSDSDGVFGDIFLVGYYKVVLIDKDCVSKFKADPVADLLDSVTFDKNSNVILRSTPERKTLPVIVLE